MNPTTRMICLIVAAAQVLSMLLAIPLIQGWVPRNHFYGVRTLRSLRGTEAEWYAINRKGGWILFWISFGLLVLVVIFLLLYR